MINEISVFNIANIFCFFLQRFFDMCCAETYSWQLISEIDCEMTSIRLKTSVIILISLNIKYIENRPRWQNSAILNSIVTPSDADELLHREREALRLKHFISEVLNFLKIPYAMLAIKHAV